VLRRDVEQCVAIGVRFGERVVKSDCRERSKVEDDGIKKSRGVGRNFEMVNRYFGEAAFSEACACYLCSHTPEIQPLRRLQNP
jgi:hypothetical protein